MHASALTRDGLSMSRTRATVLVAGVLGVHLWLLWGSASWFSAQAPNPRPAQTMVIRHVDLAPADAPKEAMAEHRRASPGMTRQAIAEPAHALAPAQTTPWTPARSLEDVASDLTAPVALPAHIADSVDLPPFNRAAPEPSGNVTMTTFKAPGSAHLRYDVKGQARHIGYAAWADLDWQQDGQQYNARLEVGAFLLGSRVQTSTGTLGHEGLMPTRFSDKSRSELAAHFQRDKNIISFSTNTPDVPLLKGAQDRLSVVLQLGALLGADPDRFPPGTMLSVQTVSQREAEMWQFVVERSERLDLPYGEVHTLKLSRNPRREFDQRIELWLAPSLGFLPARLRITNANGDFVDQQLHSVETPGP